MPTFTNQEYEQARKAAEYWERKRKAKERVWKAAEKDAEERRKRGDEPRKEFTANLRQGKFGLESRARREKEAADNWAAAQKFRKDELKKDTPMEDVEFQNLLRRLGVGEPVNRKKKGGKVSIDGRATRGLTKGSRRI
tara:strand:- start:73 stop:486 length:414 start_codon:yes stop_codon:yes gene_type:complete